MQAGPNWQASSIAWAPAWTDSSLSLEDQIVLGSALVQPNLTRRDYLLCLGQRLERLVQSTPNGMRMLVGDLSRADLLEVRPESPDEVASVVVWSNLELLARLDFMGFPGPVPREPKELPAARRQLENDSLEAWLSVVTRRPTDPDR